MKRLIGSDPELFFIGPDGYVASIGLVGGSKDAPRPISDHGDSVQEDNVAVEFNIAPAASVSAFVRSINFNLNYLEEHAKKLGLKLAVVPTAVFSAKELDKPGASVFGCDPDYNCWTRERNPKPSCDNPALRSAGGHIHIGVDGLDPWEIGRAADLFLGVPSLNYDADTERRKLYGRAGSVRPKPYGIEYRTLSNFWLASDTLKEWVFQQANRAVDFVESGNKLTPKEGVLIQRCINESDVSLMKDLMEEYGI